MKIIIISLFLFTWTLVGCSQSEKLDIQKNYEETETIESHSKIDVSLDLQIIEEKGNVEFVGKTNLPDGMELMINISNKSGYSAQSKQTVQEGSFKSGQFTNKGYPLKSGKYSIEIITPTASVQSENVKRIIGDNGINLVGDLIKHDNDWGNQLVFQEQFTVSETTSGYKTKTSPSSASIENESPPSNEEVYQYMMSAFDSITGNGENYVPEIHDSMVIRMAAQTFGISESEADQIFLKMAMQ
jgi:hypothetical protein